MAALLKDVLSGDEKSSVLTGYLKEVRGHEEQSQTEDEPLIKEESEIKEEPLTQPLNHEPVPTGPHQHNGENTVNEPQVNEEPLSQSLYNEPLNDGPQQENGENVTQNVKEEPRCQFNQHFTRAFFVQTSSWQLFLQKCN